MSLPWQYRLVFKAFLGALPLYIYSGWRITQALEHLNVPLAEHASLLLGLVYLFLNLLPIAILFTLLRGKLTSFYLLQPYPSKKDAFLTYPFWIGVLIQIEFTPYAIILDLLQGKNPFNLAIFLQMPLKYHHEIQLLLFAVISCYVLVRVWKDTNLIHKKHYHLHIPGLAPEFDNFKLFFFSDIQIDRYTGKRRFESMQQIFKNVRAPLVLFGGDLITDGEFHVDKAHQVVNQIPQAPLRISCLGDHDYWSNASRVEMGFRNNGWKVLKNEHYLFHYRGKKILITGLIYTYAARISSDKLRELMSSAPTADLKIVLVHQPSEEVIALARENGYHILLAGHTHGGQIVLKPLGFPINMARFEHQYYRGHHQIGKLNLIITNGIGLSVIPLRFRAPAEFTEIRLN